MKKPRVWIQRTVAAAISPPNLHIHHLQIWLNFRNHPTVCLWLDFILPMSMILLIYLWRKSVTTSTEENETSLKSICFENNRSLLGIEHNVRQYQFLLLKISLSLSLSTHTHTHANSENTHVVMFFYHHFVWNIIQL